MRAHVILLSMLIAATTPVLSQKKIEHLFYYYDHPDSYRSLVEHIDQISIVAPGAYSVDEDGVVWGSVDPRILKLAQAHHVGVMPLIANPGFDQEMLHKLLINDEARRRAINSLVGECKRYGYSGIQFDFENLNFNDRDAYSQFYTETAKALHKGGFLLSVAVVHRPEEYPGPTKYFKWMHTNWRAGYDLKALAQAGDFISVMTYSQHTRRTPPGPNAGLPWVQKNIEYFLRHVPSEKLSLGIPVASMHWYTIQDDELYHVNARSWSSSLAYNDALGMAERYDAEIVWLEDQGVPYTMFENGGLFEYIFFENAKTFERKLELVKKNRLRGFSVWVLGREDPAVWELLK
ncbi:MAG: glycosyl hydrolase family 18 protein [Candidatus Marinimicrobia bacterium]|nr:glycosyl hydrolase family 18 protein [Candidatus Neomarinimicrobiota bacterium]MDP6593226.1 glycosyl hydrolase family 18 protein [Candidatus Neomarinimicrobiota bacterium]